MHIETNIIGRTLRYRALQAKTPDGVTIAIQDHDRGRGGRDILFVHGFAQSSLAWLKQTSGPLADRHRLVTFDLRGHGASKKPIQDHQYYREPSRWAHELRTVIETAKLSRPVVVAWSYAGRIILDYLSEFGDGGLGGVVMVTATSTGRSDVFGSAMPLLRSMTEVTDLAANIAATWNFLAACTAQPLPPEESSLMLAYNLAVPPEVRSAMVGRPAEYDATLRALRVPLLAVSNVYRAGRICSRFSAISRSWCQTFSDQT